MKRNHITLLLFVMAGMACTSPQGDPLEQALAAAGNNRVQLEQVLAHYRQPADSLKYKAAAFLITNMPTHYANGGPEVAKYERLFAVIDTASYRKESLSNGDKAAIGDALIQNNGLPQKEAAEKIMDSRRLTARYLINNIDYAFKAWDQAPWRTKMKFEDFCEFVLPYRIRDERAEYWRPALYNDYKDLARTAPQPEDARSVFYHMGWHIGGVTAFDPFFNKYYPFAQGVDDVVRGRIGSCEVTSFYAATIMRSVGLPVALDFIPHWGNINGGHYLTHLAGGLVPRDLITNENVQRNTWYLVDWSSEFSENRHRFTKEELPEGIYIQYIRTIPKVYRYTYSPDPELSTINSTIPDSLISAAFKQVNVRDVTDEYITCTDVQVKVKPGFHKNKLVYLCVFDTEGWQPIAISRIQDGKAIFRKMGHNTMFLPTVLEGGRHRPVAPPFHIDSLGAVHSVKTAAEGRDVLILRRKYGLYPYTVYHTEVVKGGRFEGANDSTFSKPVSLYQVDHYPFFVNNVPVKDPHSFRYIRYVAPPDANAEPDNIAEVAFYGADSIAPLKGRLLGKAGISGHEIDKAFDGDLNSYYQNATNRNGWIGMDLGAGKQTKITNIRFCPRNDTNYIIPDNEYELFYWDGEQWVSMGIKIAQGYTLQYNNVPTGCLYWLRCNTGGKEERIFTYEDGQQHWW